MQSVHEGQQVRRGQIIGAVGASGRATGSHLDYRLSQNGTRINPMSALTAPGTAAVAMATVPERPAMRPATRSMSIIVR
jgi:murein DD-endopeptidase MepM/ murein hydrolase activator NlpD